MKFYDQQLNVNVSFARHAIALDENRADFAVVPWGDPKIWKDTQPIWLMQYWFAGNHSDIGGSYPENEARLSDSALQWMVEQAQGVPNGIKVDRSVLQLFPSADGPQHDECKGWLFRFAAKKPRAPTPDAILHPSVYERFKRPAVLECDTMMPYRPPSLRDHDNLEDYYKR